MTMYTTYRIFESREEAAAMQALLAKNGIPNSMEEGKAIFDTAIVGALNRQQFFVKIPQDKFLTANAILEAAIDLDALEVEDDYYLLSFTDEELLDVVKKKDEWGEFDYALAKKLLAERGIPLQEADLQLMQVKREQELKTPEKGGMGLIIGGYIMVLLHSFIAFAIGLILITSYRKLLDGTTVPKYSRRARLHGKIIAIGSLGVYGIILVFRFINDMPANPVATLLLGFVQSFF